jgi:rhamnosyltransferase
MQPRISIILRSHNDVRYIGDTLNAIRRQSEDRFELIVVDNDSTDGTAERGRWAADRFLRISAGQYRPGPVLNLASARARGDVLVFLNADATPQGSDWLSHLVDPLLAGRAVATFGRQLPRGDARPWVRLDYARAFGDGSEQSKWRHFFSLANAALLRRVWAQRPFSATLRYSEDVDWSLWCRESGMPVVYAPAARATHSHNYTLRESWRRHYGEGEAEAEIFGYVPKQDTFARRLLARWAASIVRDVAHLCREGQWPALLRSVPVRSVERIAGYVGFQKGLRRRRALHTVS